jgi:hypothetical protein
MRASSTPMVASSICEMTGIGCQMSGFRMAAIASDHFWSVQTPVILEF